MVLLVLRPRRGRDAARCRPQQPLPQLRQLSLLLFPCCCSTAAAAGRAWCCCWWWWRCCCCCCWCIRPPALCPHPLSHAAGRTTATIAVRAALRSTHGPQTEKKEGRQLTRREIEMLLSPCSSNRALRVRVAKTPLSIFSAPLKVQFCNVQKKIRKTEKLCARDDETSPPHQSNTEGSKRRCV